MPRHKMAEGHIEFTLSVCVCFFVCVCFHLFICVFKNPVWPISSFCMIGFENKLTLAKMIIMTRGCVANKNYFTS